MVDFETRIYSYEEEGHTRAWNAYGYGTEQLADCTVQAIRIAFRLQELEPKPFPGSISIGYPVVDSSGQGQVTKYTRSTKTWP